MKVSYSKKVIYFLPETLRNITCILFSLSFIGFFRPENIKTFKF